MVTLRETTVPVDRRLDVGVVEIDLRGIEFRLALLDRGLVERDLGLALIVDALRIVDGILRHRIGPEQPLVALVRHCA